MTVAAPPAPAGPAVTRIVGRKVSKTFDRRPIFQEVDLEVAAGEVLIVAGPNGVGKSTLLRILAGLARPTSGQVVFESAAGPLEGEARLRSIGYIAPDLRPYDELSAAENLEILSRIRGRRAADAEIAEILGRVGLSRVGPAPVGTYSTGMRQRLRMGIALIAHPTALLLDEPGSNLDAEGRSVLAAFVAEARGRGPVIIATNDPEEARLGERRLELKRLDDPGTRRP